MRVLTSINGCHSNTNFCMIIKDICFGKGGVFFNDYGKHLLCSHRPIGHSLTCKESLACGWLEI